jgi:hypothetical protein
MIPGATSCTECAAHGHGARGIRPRYAEPANTKIEVIATQEVAKRIVEYTAQHQFGNYPMMVFLDDVEVLRAEKFGAYIGAHRSKQSRVSTLTGGKSFLGSQRSTDWKKAGGSQVKLPSSE